MHYRLCLLVVLAAPLYGAVTNFSEVVTYRDVIEAKRKDEPLPKPAPAPIMRVVGRKGGKLLVETRYPLGGVTTNARTLHVIYGAATVATNVRAQVAYDAAVARYVRAVAVEAGALNDADSKDAEALQRQAARLNAAAEKSEKKSADPGKGGRVAILGGGLAAGAAAVYGATRVMAAREAA